MTTGAGLGRAVRWFAPSPKSATLALLLLASAGMAPVFVWGVSDSDSFRFNYIWLRQFADAVSWHQPYPRWLSASFSGWGSPAFYFYPPLAFFIDALSDRLSFGLLSVEHRIMWLSWLLVFLSGASMLAWLRPQASPAWALAMAAAYMLAPYHLLDYYWRGALAELSAYPVLPLVALSLRQCRTGPAGAPRLALAYAALMTAHVPTALLASVFLLAPYALFLVASAPRPLVVLTRCALGGVSGLCIGSNYLLPALSLQDYINTYQLWNASTDPRRWTLLSFFVQDFYPFMAVLLLIGAGYGLGVLGLLIAARRRGWGEAGLWAGCASFAMLAIAGCVPLIWSVPLLQTVQYPFRMFVLTEFTMLTGLALIGPAWRGWSRALLIACPAMLLTAYGTMAWHLWPLAAASRQHWAGFLPVADAHVPDAPEYVPSGFPYELFPAVIGPGPWTLPPALSVTCVPDAAQCETVRPVPGGPIRVSVIASQPTDVTVAQFYFPSWTASASFEPAPHIRPSERLRLLEFGVPPGTSSVSLDIGLTGAERAGRAVSLAGIVMAAISWFVSRRAGH